MKRLDTKGSSMVSVIVSFVILLMGISMFTSAMFTATDLAKEADDVRRRVSEATEKFYINSTASDVVSELKVNGIILRPTDGGAELHVDGNGFSWRCKEDYTLYYFAHNQK